MFIGYNFACNHDYYAIATHVYFYFVKFGRDNVMEACGRFLDHLLKKCHSMSQHGGVGAEVLDWQRDRPRLEEIERRGRGIETRRLDSEERVMRSDV